VGRNKKHKSKWEGTKNINLNIKKIGDHLVKFNNSDRKSYIYHLENERNEANAHTVISQLKTYRQELNNSDEEVSITQNSYPDASDKTYAQLATFKKIVSEPNTNYFMIVNRRCAPYAGINSVDNIGGRRLISLKFNANKLLNFNNWKNKLLNFNNWKIIDLSNDSVIAVINKNSNTEYSIGFFLPGELYKIVPVMQ